MGASPALSMSSMASNSYTPKVKSAQPPTFVIPPSVRQSIIDMRAAGKSKSEIAKELKISRNTVDRFLRLGTQEQDWTATTRAIIPVAFDALHKAILKGDGQLAMRFLERTILKDEQPKAVTDNRVQMAIGTLMTTSTPITTMTTSGNSTLSTTEAPARHLPVTDAVQSHGQNFPVLENGKPSVSNEIAKPSAQLSFDFDGLGGS